MSRIRDTGCQCTCTRDLNLTIFVYYVCINMEKFFVFALSNADYFPSKRIFRREFRCLLVFLSSRNLVIWPCLLTAFGIMWDFTLCFHSQRVFEVKFA
jgi:hypothetical protein